MDLIQKITQTIEPSIESMGYRLVMIKLAEGSRRRTLTIMAERVDGQMMSFDDCTEISRTVSALLDVEDPIQGAYDLEVSSPGIDRPLTRPEDFKRFAGFEGKIETTLPVNGRKRFKGVIKGIENDMITLAMPEGETEIPFRLIRIAKLVMTDELLAAHMKSQKKKKA